MIGGGGGLGELAGLSPAGTDAPDAVDGDRGGIAPGVDGVGG